MSDQDLRERLHGEYIFSDDTALVVEPAELTQCLLTEFGRVCEGRKLRVNVEETRF